MTETRMTPDGEATVIRQDNGIVVEFVPAEKKSQAAIDRQANYTPLPKSDVEKLLDHAKKEAWIN